jgi:hypothetical protein
MPVRVIGMIGVTPPSGDATVHVIKGGISTAYLRAFAQARDTAGFDLALVDTPPPRPRVSLSPSTPLNAPNGLAS